MSKEILYECADAWYPEYKVKVVRDAGGGGTLTVTLKKKILRTQHVELSYGAIFGADMFDVQAWGHIACAVVNADLHKKGKTAEPPKHDRNKN